MTNCSWKPWRPILIPGRRPAESSPRRCREALSLSVQRTLSRSWLREELDKLLPPLLSYLKGKGPLPRLEIDLRGRKEVLVRELKQALGGLSGGGASPSRGGSRRRHRFCKDPGGAAAAAGPAASCGRGIPGGGRTGNRPLSAGIPFPSLLPFPGLSSIPAGRFFSWPAGEPPSSGPGAFLWPPAPSSCWPSGRSGERLLFFCWTSSGFSRRCLFACRQPRGHRHGFHKCRPGGVGPPGGRFFCRRAYPGGSRQPRPAAGISPLSHGEVDFGSS